MASVTQVQKWEFAQLSQQSSEASSGGKINLKKAFEHATA